MAAGMKKDAQQRTKTRTPTTVARARAQQRQRESGQSVLISNHAAIGGLYNVQIP